MFIDLTKGIAKTRQYEAWKFPGGEIHFKFTEECIKALDATEGDEYIAVTPRLNSSDDIIFLGLVLSTLDKDWTNLIKVFIPYMPYQQADRDFSVGECFSLPVIAKILESFPCYSYTIFDPHSDVSPALLSTLTKCHVIDNSEYIEWVIRQLIESKNSSMYNSSVEPVKHFLTDELIWNPERDLVILSPDAGAYKKIFKLCEKIGFKGQIETANKYRDTTSGKLQVRLSIEDFNTKDVLIIDDICIGGRTFIALAEQLMGKNISNLHLAISHGIFSNGFEELEMCFQHIYTTNSVKDDYDCDSVEVYECI